MCSGRAGGFDRQRQVTGRFRRKRPFPDRLKPVLHFFDGFGGFTLG